jgi:hypothetical protein
MTTTTNPPADDLKPCPFCGQGEVTLSYLENAMYQFACLGCASIWRTYATSKVHAREIWNTRATPPAAPAESVTELCANNDNLREYIDQIERERDEARARAIQAWKDADAAIAKEVESRVASIMGSPDNEIARLTASRNVFRDERDALQAERNTLRSQLAHARSRGDDKEIAEKERDAARAELAAMRAWAVTDEMVDLAHAELEYLHDGPPETQVTITETSVRAALQAVMGSGWIKCSNQLPSNDLVSTPMHKAGLWGHIPELQRAGDDLIPADDGCRIVYFYRDGFWQVAHSPSNYVVTHWRPLPPPPGEGE